MGRCIYGGIYDPSNKNGLIDENGFRTDVIDCMKALKVPISMCPRPPARLKSIYIEIDAKSSLFNHTSAVPWRKLYSYVSLVRWRRPKGRTAEACRSCLERSGDESLWYR